MSKSLGQPSHLSTRASARAAISPPKQVARAEPDGYTLLLVTTAHLVSPALYNSLGYDSIRRLRLHLVGDQRSVLHRSPMLTRPTKPSGFVDAAKATPGTLTIGTAGVGPDSI
jgi:tripartite-type tricarboxylate transporter receptor subunit TctC